MTDGLLREYRRVDLGLVEYGAAWRWQKAMVGAHQAAQVPDTLALLEHPHVYTLGRTGHREHILIDPEEQSRRGVTVFEVDRGGDVTYHGPGQLVGYPILDLTPWQGDVRRYVRMLEDVLIRTLADHGIAAGQIPGLTGVWVGEEKVAAIGVKVSRGVTSHGFALNVNTDLWFFSQIIPCGIRDKGVTSMARLGGAPLVMGEVADRVAHHFEAVFGYAPAESHPVAREEMLRFGGDA